MGVYHLDELYDCNRHLYLSLLRGCKKDSLFQWVVAREHGESTTAVSFIEAHIGTPLYKRDDLWNGINVFSEARLRKRDPSLLNNI